MSVPHVRLHLNTTVVNRRDRKECTLEHYAKTWRRTTEDYQGLAEPLSSRGPMLIGRRNGEREQPCFPPRTPSGWVGAHPLHIQRRLPSVPFRWYRQGAPAIDLERPASQPANPLSRLSPLSAFEKYSSARLREPKACSSRSCIERGLQLTVSLLRRMFMPMDFRKRISLCYRITDSTFRDRTMNGNDTLRGGEMRKGANNALKCTNSPACRCNLGNAHQLLAYYWQTSSITATRRLQY